MSKLSSPCCTYTNHTISTNLTSFCSTDMPLYDQVHDLLRVVEVVLQLSTKKSLNGPKNGNILYPKVIKCVGVTLDSGII